MTFDDFDTTVTNEETQDYSDYVAAEELREIESDLVWYEHWDEFDAELEDINIVLEQAAHLEKFDEIFDVIHPSIQGSR